MDRDALVESLRGYLKRATRRFVRRSRILDPEGLATAVALSDVAAPNDVEAWYLIAMVHFVRAQALPDHEAEDDLRMALELFAQLLDVDEELVPGPVRDYLRAEPGLVREALLASDDPSDWNNVALDLFEDPRTAGDVQVLGEVIDLMRRVVATTSDEDPNRARRLSNLGIALQTRFGRTGEIADLEEAITVGRNALAAVRTDQEDRATCLANLSAGLQMRFEHQGQPVDLEEAINTGRDAVAAVRADHPDRAGWLSNLGGALRTRFERSGRLADLEEAVAVSREAAASTSTDGPDRGAKLANLSTALLVRFERSGRLADLDEAVAVSRDAVQCTFSDHPAYSSYLSSLGGALRIRFGRLGKMADLDEAIEVGRRAVAAIPADHPDRGRRLSALGIVLHARFQSTGVLSDLDEAVAVARSAVAVTSANHPKYAGMLSNLGVALRTRFDRAGNVADLDEAIGVGRAAVAAVGADHPDSALALSNLGVALRARFDRTGDVADLDEAISALSAGVAATSAVHPDRAALLANLGNAAQSRFRDGGDPADLEEGIAAFRAAVAAVPDDHPTRASLLSNLGVSLRDRFDHTGSVSDLEEAVLVLREGAGVMTAPPLSRAAVGRRWADAAASHGDAGQARLALAGVLDMLPELVDHSLGEADRLHHLEGLRGLGRAAAWAELTGADDVADPHRVDAAWSALEAGRGVLLSQALDARDDLMALRESHPALADDVERLRARLNGELRDPRLIDDGGGRAGEAGHRRRLAEQWRDVLDRVRAVPGQEMFGRPPTVDQLRAGLAEGTVVAINLTAYGCAALLLDSQHSDHVELTQLTERDAVEQSNRFMRAVRADTADTGTLFEVLAWMWDTITGPVLERLAHTATPGEDRVWPRVWWIPTGALSTLPIHAAGHHDDPQCARRRAVLDRVVSSYTPTVRALHQAARRSQVGHTSSGGDISALVVGVDTTADGTAPPLRSAVAEARRTHRQLRSTGPVLLGPAATRAAVEAALPAARWAHFACHGAVDYADPANSRLLLFDGPLTVSELNRLELPDAYLAYLSACSTATNAPQLVDEAVHIAAAFQVAGFAHTIATLWPISDLLAPFIAADIHRQSAAGIPPAVAVHETVRTVRGQHPDNPDLWGSHVHFGP